MTQAKPRVPLGPCFVPTPYADSQEPGSSPSLYPDLGLLPLGPAACPPVRLLPRGLTADTETFNCLLSVVGLGGVKGQLTSSV